MELKESVHFFVLMNSATKLTIGVLAITNRILLLSPYSYDAMLLVKAPLY